MKEMQSDWAEAQRLVLYAGQAMEKARSLLVARATAPAECRDWILAQEMADFLGVVADGAWSVRVQLVKAREVLLDAEAARAVLTDPDEPLLSARVVAAATTVVPDR